jgi:hypothetical protein
MNNRQSCVISVLVLAAFLDTRFGMAGNPCAETFDECVQQKPQGCIGKSIDHVLDGVKNRTDKVENAEKWTLSRIIQLNPETNKLKLKMNGNRQKLQTIGEGTPVMVKGYLIHAKESGQEACNCNIDEPDSFDFHLNLISTKTTSGEKNLSAKNKQKSRMKRSVVVEITPRIRVDHPEWTIQKLKEMAKPDDFGYVQITGWLMFDSRHTSKDAPRATAWEVHPITEFNVCESTKEECDAGEGWQSLDEH